MYKLNFLPAKLKEKHYKQTELFKSITLTVLLIMNIFFALKLYNMFYTLDNLEKKVGSSINKKSVMLYSNESNKAIDFLFNNILNNFKCNHIKIKDKNIEIKFLIQDRAEFIDYIKKVENMKECTIKYINPPYTEDGKYQFEMGLECIK